MSFLSSNHREPLAALLGWTMDSEARIPFALTVTIVPVFLLLALLTALGREAQGIRFRTADASAAPAT